MYVLDFLVKSSYLSTMQNNGFAFSTDVERQDFCKRLKCLHVFGNGGSCRLKENRRTIQMISSGPPIAAAYTTDAIVEWMDISCESRFGRKGRSTGL